MCRSPNCARLVVSWLPPPASNALAPPPVLPPCLDPCLATADATRSRARRTRDCERRNVRDGRNPLYAADVSRGLPPDVRQVRRGGSPPGDVRQGLRQVPPVRARNEPAG